MEISNILQYAGYNVGEHFQIRGIFGSDNWENVLEWFHPIDPYPTEQQINLWQSEYETEVAEIELTNQTIENSIGGIKEKIELATGFANELKTLYLAILDATETQQTLENRFQTLSLLIQTQPNAIKNRFYKDLEFEARINFLVVLPTITDSQKSTFCLYMRLWITGLILLLIMHKL